jgi:hypothetical protein
MLTDNCSSEIDESRLFARHSPSQLPNYSTTRQRMPIMTAYQILDDRENLLVSDRLAILSNLTQYRFRINTHEIVNRNLSFTACVMALALQNGETQAFGFLSGGNAEDATAINTGGSIAVGSWLPSPDFSLTAVGTGGVKLSSIPNYGGVPAYVLGRKGLFCGLIWDVEAYHTKDLADVAEVLPALLELATDTHSVESALWLKVILQVLLHHFLSAGFLELAELIILCALERQFEDPDEGQDLLSRVESWVRDGDDDSWPCELHSPPPDRQEVRQGMSQLGPPHGLRPVLYWICDQLATNKLLPVGRCVVQPESNGDGRLFGLFAVDPARHRKIFTPLNALEYEFGTSIIAPLISRHQFAAIEEVGGEVSDEDTRQAMNLLHKGRDAPLDPKVYRIQKTSNQKAVWSQRLSRNGILVKNNQGDWTRTPLGQGK